MSDPETREEWQAAVDAAHACLSLDAARQYGLIDGGPKIDAARCLEILDRGKALGITPAPDAPDRLVAELAAPDPRGPGLLERAAADFLP
jgi:hypothetical protein